VGYLGNEPADVAVTVGQGVIDATHIQDASITTADLGNDAVTPNKVDDDATGFQMGSLGLGGAVSGSDKLTVTGDGRFTGTVRIPHDTTDALRIGASDDLELWHNGTDSAVTNANTGKLYLWNYANGDTVIGSNNVESAVFTGANTTLRGTINIAGTVTSSADMGAGRDTGMNLRSTNSSGYGFAVNFQANDGTDNDRIVARLYSEPNNANTSDFRIATRSGGTLANRLTITGDDTTFSSTVKIAHDTYPQLTIDGTDNSGNIGINFIGSGSRGGIQWNGSNNNVEILREDGSAEILVTYNNGTQFNNDVRINGNGTGVSKKLRFYTTNNIDDSKWIAVDENYFNVYHAHHNEGHLFRDQTGHLVKMFGNSGGNAETTFGTSSRNNNPRIYGNLRMNAANSISFQNASADETVSLWNGGGSNHTVLYQSGGLRLTGTTNSATSGKGRGQIQATGNTALSASTNWTSVRTLVGDYQSGILIFHVQDTGNAANTRCQIYAFNADYYERGVNSIDNVTGGVAPGGIEVRIVRDDGSTTSDGGGPYTIQCRPANGTSSLGVRLLILSAGTD